MTNADQHIDVSDWKQLALSKRVATFSKIPKSWLLPLEHASQYTSTNPISVLNVPRESGLLTQKELDITELYDATDLVALMAKGTLTSVEVVTAFCKRASIAHQTTNCLTEIFFDAALERARSAVELLPSTSAKAAPVGSLIFRSSL